MHPLITGQDLVFTLLLKVGSAASLAAILARSATFRQVLYTEQRDFDQKLRLLLFATPPFLLGVILRLFGYRFADLSLEGSFLLGLLGGRVVGPLGGAMMTIPTLFVGEWLGMPAASFAGLLGGLIRQVMPNKEAVWNFGPFLFLSVPRWLTRLIRERRGAWEMLPLAACVVLELGRVAVGVTLNPKWIFFLHTAGGWNYTLLLLATIMSVAVPIKIWQNTRIEMNLERHQQLLLKARMDALSSQINPHFLFNTLNTVSSLIRYDPDTARIVLLKLSNILRRLLRKHETFVPLREELDFIDDYLDIEVVRFGRDKLQIHKQFDESALDAYVPSMLLQPIIENSIKHGLAPKLDGGEIHLRGSHQNGRLILEIEDNGIGIPDDRLPHVFAEGIGVSNVHERLKLLYGQDFRFDVISQLGAGTTIRIEVPELLSVSPAAN